MQQNSSFKNKKQNCIPRLRQRHDRRVLDLRANPHVLAPVRKQRTLTVVVALRVGACTHSRDLSSSGMYIQSRQREAYQAPACIYRAGRERSIKLRHVYTEQAERGLSSPGMYIQSRQREVYQAPACIYRSRQREVYQAPACIYRAGRERSRQHVDTRTH